MMELIRNAWPGWQNYADAGKFAALLLIALLFFWFARKKGGNRYYTLILYTTVMVVCCICPLTAAVLMSYQTKFYDYRWIWNLVPVTIVVALVGTLLWTGLMDQYVKQKGSTWKRVGITITIVAIVYLSGRMGNTIWDAENAAEKRNEAEIVLERMEEMDAEDGYEAEMVLWAPQAIMEYVRALDGDIRLLYGRNMWDPALNAYSYDVYGESEKILYEWMTHAEETGKGVLRRKDETGKTKNFTVKRCVNIAKWLGVTHILLPKNMKEQVLANLTKHLKMQPEMVDGYYLYRIGWRED